MKEAKKFDENFVNLVENIVKVSESKGIKIRGWDGLMNPTINETTININGCKELSHENFLLETDVSAEFDWEFCKTARKPYDSTVLAILMAAKDFGYIDNYYSDGENNEEFAKEIYKEAFNM